MNRLYFESPGNTNIICRSRILTKIKGAFSLGASTRAVRTRLKSIL